MRLYQPRAWSKPVNVPGTGNTLGIPLIVDGNGSGRVGLGSLSIIYDLPTFVMSSRIANSSECAIYCNMSSPRIINSTLSGNSLDIQMGSESEPVLLNTTFSESKLLFTDELADQRAPPCTQHLSHTNFSGPDHRPGRTKINMIY